jgi:hypothetical protein
MGHYRFEVEIIFLSENLKKRENLAAGSSQREKEIFFAKKFLFLSFRVSQKNTLFISHYEPRN